MGGTPPEGQGRTLQSEWHSGSRARGKREEPRGRSQLPAAFSEPSYRHLTATLESPVPARPPKRASPPAQGGSVYVARPCEQAQPKRRRHQPRAIAPMSHVVQLPCENIRSIAVFISEGQFWRANAESLEPSPTSCRDGGLASEQAHISAHHMLGGGGSDPPQRLHHMLGGGVPTTPAPSPHAEGRGGSWTPPETRGQTLPPGP